MDLMKKFVGYFYVYRFLLLNFCLIEFGIFHTMKFERGFTACFNTKEVLLLPTLLC
jgi:hypothetical protein